LGRSTESVASNSSKTVIHVVRGVDSGTERKRGNDHRVAGSDCTRSIHSYRHGYVIAMSNGSNFLELKTVNHDGVCVSPPGGGLMFCRLRGGPRLPPFSGDAIGRSGSSGLGRPPIPCALYNCANNCHYPRQTPESRHFTPAKFGTGLASTVPGGSNIRRFVRG
jgi:hypothetical protein